MDPIFIWTWENFLYGRETTLYCCHGGYPRPNITWTSDGLEWKEFYNKNRIYLKRDDINRNKNYTCHVSNGVGPNFTHNFEVNWEPNIFWTEYSFLELPVEKQEGETVVVNCEAKNYSNIVYE